jgi:dissimilatory sulfite reductase (desulfoviridin) alpha/beta subunit
MLSAAARDLNPWIRGYGGELVSKLAVLHPGVGRQTSQEIALQNDGWMTADGLFLLAELSEKSGAGLVEFSGPDNGVRLLALAPDAGDLPWNGLRRSGLAQADAKAVPGCCPFWGGPCLGHRGYLSEAFAELAAEIGPYIDDGFRVELAGCPHDCRLAAAKSDLAIILDSEASSFVIWLGGRHRPFRDRVLPRPWLRQDVSGIREMLDLVFKVHDLWASLAMGKETLPELVARLGQGRFEEHLATGEAPRRRHRSGPTPVDSPNGHD